jgi:hypothetical protein
MHGPADIRQKSDLACLLDCKRQLTLVFGTCPGDSSGDNFTPFSDKLPQAFWIFVIDFHPAVHAESAGFAALVKPVFSASLTFIHALSPLRSILL